MEEALFKCCKARCKIKAFSVALKKVLQLLASTIATLTNVMGNALHQSYFLPAYCNKVMSPPHSHHIETPIEFGKIIQISYRYQMPPIIIIIFIELRWFVLD